MKKYILHIIGLLLLMPILQRCSTEKNTFASRSYHRITSHYNVYFNANESLKSGIQHINANLDDDFTKLLPIYKESNPLSVNMVKLDMDNTIIKTSKLIELHSITEKPKRRRKTKRYQKFASKNEFNPWIDNSYLLMGKAYFFQHNFNLAIDNFTFIIRKYGEGDARHEANIWLIRSYSELERYAEAEEVIKAVQNDKEYPEKLKKDLAIATADFYIKQQEYEKAINYIDIALDRLFWRKSKGRLLYIKAQLYEEIGNHFMAAQSFLKVTKMNPDYRMAFNAKINAAGGLAENGNTEKIKRELRKMLKEKKNEEFKDQIYYTLGNICFKEGDKICAIDNYRKSVASSYNNHYQRAQSAITVADIYFEEKKYKQAQAYYDSAMIIIDDNYPDYSKLSDKYNNLTSLIENLLTVDREDSLQQIARLPILEREQFISNLIKKEQKRQKILDEKAIQGGRNQSYYRFNKNRLSDKRQGTGWYFYNPQTVAYGEVNFKQRWGGRKLEDNWRRSNKRLISIDNVEDIDDLDELNKIEEKRIKDPLQKEYYTQDLPLTDSLLLISNEKIRDALYYAGKIYKSEFVNYKRAAEVYEELLDRYPENIYKLPVLFDLYDLYEIMGNNQKSQLFKNKITTEYPKSKYAQYLINPEFFALLKQKEDSINNIYEDTYRNYKSGNYKEVVHLTQVMKEMNPDSVIIHKIDFMQTIALGTETSIYDFENLLKEYINNYKKEETTLLANEILTLIQDSTLTNYQQLVDMGYINEEIQNKEVIMKGRMENDEFGGKFSYDDDLLHYFVVVFPKSVSINENRLKFDIANYNIDHYTKFDFDIDVEEINDKSKLIVVRALNNKEDALIYHRSIIRNASVFRTLKDVDYKNFVVSSANYRQIISERSVADYLKFFIKNYSRYISSDFSGTQTLVSPQEMMDRARREREILKDKGEFRVVDTARKQIFDTYIGTNQNFVIAIKDTRLSLGRLINEFNRFNKEEFNAWNLKISVKRISNYQILIIDGIPSFNESLSYFRKVVINRELFQSLGKVTYRNFLITDKNLEKVINEEKINDYIEFFREYYIKRGAEGGKDAAEKSKKQSSLRKIDNQQQRLKEYKQEYKGLYDKNIDGNHFFVIVIPSSGVDKQAFINNIEQFNKKNKKDSIKIKEVVIDEYRIAIVFFDFNNSKESLNYSQNFLSDKQLFSILSSVNYRVMIISEQNFEIFKKDKNITDYQKFYKSTYSAN